MRTRTLTLAFLALVLLTTATAAQDKAQKIDQLLKKYQEYGQFNGSVLVADEGKVIYKKGFGMANMEWDLPNTAETKFRIGSVTKQFTAAMIMQLVEEGKVKLDGKLTDYLPEYRKDTGDRITVHQLLNHTSGIPSYTGLPGFIQNDSRDPYEVGAFIKKFASGDLEFEPGTKFNYNNSAYFILGAIIEKVTGKPYAEALRERILDPVGMNDTGYDTASPLIKRRASGYQQAANGFVNAGYLDMSLPYAAGSMYSTVEDLYKWDQALYGDKIISPASKTVMFTPGMENFGYGFVITERPVAKGATETTTIVEHGGGINGFNSLFTRDIDRRHLVVILDNVGQGRYHEAITGSILNILNGQPYEGPKRSIADTLASTAMDKGGAAAVAEYRRLRNSKPAEYDFSEGELNSLGYRLLERGKTKDAIEIFKLNVEMFPEASNPYDSLGEAYLKDGQKDLALANYKKSVELNPKNTNGIAYIRQIEGTDVKVDTAVLDSYVGGYELAPNFILTITREGDKLFGQATGQGKLRLMTLSATEFSAAQVQAKITFEKDASGEVTGLSLEQGGRVTKAKRVK